MIRSYVQRPETAPWQQSPQRCVFGYVGFTFEGAAKHSWEELPGGAVTAKAILDFCRGLRWPHRQDPMAEETYSWMELAVDYEATTARDILRSGRGGSTLVPAPTLKAKVCTFRAHIELVQ